MSEIGRQLVKAPLAAAISPPVVPVENNFATLDRAGMANIGPRFFREINKCNLLVCKCNLFIHGAPRSSQELVSEASVYSRIELEFENLVFKERGKPEYPEKNPSEQSREPTTNSTYI